MISFNLVYLLWILDHLTEVMEGMRLARKYNFLIFDNETYSRMLENEK